MFFCNHPLTEAVESLGSVEESRTFVANRFITHSSKSTFRLKSLGRLRCTKNFALVVKIFLVSMLVKMQLRICFKNAISVLEKSPYCSLVIIEKFKSNGLQFGRQQQPDARPTGHTSPVAAARALGDLSRP